MTKLKLWQTSSSQIVTQLKNSNFDKVKQKTQIATKLKNSNCDQNFKNQIVTKLKNSNCDKTHNLQLWQNSETPSVATKKIQIVTKLKNSNWDKTQNLQLWQNSETILKLENLCHSDRELSESQRALKSHQWFKVYSHFTEGVYFT